MRLRDCIPLLTPRRLALLLLLGAATALAAAAPASASVATCTDIWTGNGGDGLWSDAANWDNGPPQPTDVVCIGQGASVELDAATMNFTVTGLELDGATLTTDGSESLTVTGELDLQNATPGNTATPDVLGSGLSLTSEGTTNVDPDLDVCENASATLTFGSQATVTLGSGADLGASDSGACGGNSGGGQITDEGTIIAPSSAIIAPAYFDDDGAVQETGSGDTLMIRGSSSNGGDGDTGTYAVAQGATLEFDTTSRTINYTGASGTTFSGGGTLVLNSGTIDFESDANLAALNRVEVDSGATAEVDDTLEGPAGGTGPTVAINGDLDGYGFVTLPAGTTTTLGLGGLTTAQLGEEVDVENQGTMAIAGSAKVCVDEGATLENAGLLTLGSNANLGHSAANSSCDPSGTLLNDQSGSISSTGSTTIQTDTFDNAGTVTVGNNSNLVLDASNQTTDTGGYVVPSNGTLLIQGSNLSRVLEGTLSGSGKLSVTGSNTSLEIMPGASDTIGSLNVGGGATLQLDAGPSTPQSGSVPPLVVTGGATFTGGTVAFNGDALGAPNSTETLGLLGFGSRTGGTPSFPADDNGWSASFGTVDGGSGIVATVTPVPPQNETPPTISGSAAQGGTLTVTQGSWSGSPTQVSDQWEDCDPYGDPCTPVGSGSTYSPTENDVGNQIEVVETASNSGGSNTADSAMTNAVTTLAPVNLSPPEIDGDEGTVGEVLTELPGQWQNSPRIVLQWEDCDITGTVCTPIPGATGGSYTTTKNDVNDSIVVVETATNAYGSAQAESDPSEPLIDLGDGLGDDPTDGSGGSGGRSSGTATVSVPAHSVSGTDLSIGLRCPEKSSCPVTITLTATESATTSHAHAAADAHHPRSRVVVVGSQTVQIGAGDHRTVTVALNRTGTKLLASEHTLRTVLTASSTRRTLERTSVTFTAAASNSSKRSKPSRSSSRHGQSSHKRRASTHHGTTHKPRGHH
ncbi:MAG TPA: hypothetical protein VMF07_18430 [Solirubrobacteraceae bacterium]|nr:hypothetical protein [Solirubrobacteraceae bacterium]